MANPLPTTPSSKGADAAGGPSPMTAAATLFASRSRSSPSSTSTSPSTISTPTPDNGSEIIPTRRARSVDRARIIIDNHSNAMSVELMNDPLSGSGEVASKMLNISQRTDNSSDGDDESENGFSDTDGASSSSSSDGDGDDSDGVSAVSSDNGYLQINLNGGTMQVVDRTITSPQSSSTKASLRPTTKPDTPAKRPSPSTLTPSTPKVSALPTIKASVASSSPPPPPPPPPPSSLPPPPHHKKASESPNLVPGPLQYPPGIPRHKRERVLLPSPLPSPAKSARNLWRKSSDRGDSPVKSNGGSDSGGGSSSKTSSAAASILAANVTPGTPKSRKRRSSKHNTPRRSDSSGDVDSSLIMEQGRRRREEQSLSRLVDMAKRQQRFAAAWFAASQGNAAADVPPPPPIPKQGQGPQVLPLSAAVTMHAVSSTGPIDVDSGEAIGALEGEPSKNSNGDATSQLSVGSRSPRAMQGGSPTKKGVLVAHFLSSRGSQAERKPTADDVSFVSSSSSKTPKIANTSPNRRSGDVERGLPASPPVEDEADIFIDLSNDEAEKSSKGGDTFWTREVSIGPCRLGAANIFVIALLLIIVAGAAIIVVVGSSGGQVAVDDRGDAIIQEEGGGIFGGDGEARDDVTNLPPVEGDVSDSLDDVWSDLNVTVKTPTSIPTMAPSSSSPTQLPSFSPTFSREPSLQPTLPPTSVYQTTTYSQVGKTIPGSDPDVQSGYSVALSADGKVMAVGSRYADDNGPRSGEVRVFVLTSNGKRNKGEESGALVNGAWEQLGKTIKGRNEADQFGFSVSLSGDGLTLAASEPGYDGDAGDRSGNVRVFRYDSGEPKLYGTDGSWAKIGDISGEDSTALFGVSVSLSGDGRRLAVGSPYFDSDALDAMGEPLRKSGRVRVFEYQNTEWAHIGQPIDGTSPSDWFGWSVSLSVDGMTCAAGAIRHISGGYVRVYMLDDKEEGVGPEKWKQLGEDLHSVLPEEDTRLDDRFGHAVALSGDGSRIVIGSPNSDPGGVDNAGMAVIYQRSSSDSNDTNLWSVLGDPIFGKDERSELGWDVALSDDSTHVVLGAPGDSTLARNAGSAIAYRWSDNAMVWEDAKPLFGDEEEDSFGFSVAVSDDGSLVGVGAPAQSGDDISGYARVFLHED